MEKQIGYDLDSQLDPVGKNITVVELVERYVRTKTGVRDSTRAGYRTVQRILDKEPFEGKNTLTLCFGRAFFACTVNIDKMLKDVLAL